MKLEVPTLAKMICACARLPLQGGRREKAVGEARGADNSEDGLCMCTIATWKEAEATTGLLRKLEMRSDVPLICGGRKKLGRQQKVLRITKDSCRRSTISMRDNKGMCGLRPCLEVCPDGRRITEGVQRKLME